MVKWLQEKSIPFQEKLTKPELYKIIQANKPRFPPVCALDYELGQHGHQVLRLPPYHPELNPIEKIWALVKGRVAPHNTTFNINDIENITRITFSEVLIEEWARICKHVQKYENTQIAKEHLLDSTLDHLQFFINTGSSEESLSDNKDSD
ncbi:uncharacterized protein [Diabrotica undecimpunctata]|uniref:uncharacterized protein n=1 Tax=Diabrotica undecimpunctata TaxID=50387 RepID=UPI003B63719F